MLTELAQGQEAAEVCLCTVWLCRGRDGVSCLLEVAEGPGHAQGSPRGGTGHSPGARAGGTSSSPSPASAWVSRGGLAPWEEGGVVCSPQSWEFWAAPEMGGLLAPSSGREETRQLPGESLGPGSL